MLECKHCSKILIQFLLNRTYYAYSIDELKIKNVARNLGYLLDIFYVSFEFIVMTFIIVRHQRMIKNRCGIEMQSLF